VVLVLAIAISGSVVYYNKLVNESYQLPVGIQALIGQPDKVLLSQFTYSSQNHAYYLSKSSINTSSSEFPKTSPLSDSFTLGSNSKVKGQFSLKLPTNAGLGITTYDDTSNLSFTMIPQFSTLAGRQVSGHIVYPVGLSGAKVIYTIKANGAQEDIVYNRAPKNTIRLSYKLKLPTTLQARMMTGGNIGIYSANPALFGNISYGSSADELKVAKARQDSAKDNLVFVIPASTIITADGKLPISSNRGVSLSLSGDIVTVTAKGLENLRGAFSIDPSVIVVSVSNWQTGNNEGDITFDSTNNQISEGGLTGGELSSNSCGTSVSWCASSTTANTGFSLPVATSDASTVVYNGYIYFMGGINGGSVTIPTVDYAVLNANGSLGAPGSCAGTQETDWCESSTTANTGFSLPIGTDAATTTVYNGYIYLMGGYNASWAIVPTVDYAVLNANGSLGAPGSCAGTQETDWCESSTTANTGFSLPIGTYSATTTVYNGYIYLIGGNNTGSSAVPTVDYAPIYNGGGIGPWVSTTSLPTATDYASAVAYNGYIYLMGGNTGSSAVPTVDYAQITSAGAVSNWSYSTSLSTGSLPNAIDVSTSVVYNGYIYEIGGCEPGCTDIPTVDYVAINSNGTLGTWYSTATLPYADSYSTAVAYNGYLYNIGGCSAGGSGCPSTVVDYASINSNGTLGAWTPTASLPAGGDYEASSVVYNGYIYEIGGCAASCPSTVVDYAAINSDGTLGAWTPLTSSSLPVAIAYANAVVYNGYIYEVDATTSTVYYASINSDGTLGSWGTASSSLPSGGVGVATDVVYNGYLYNIGGWADAAVDYAPINSNGTLGAWTATTSLVTGTGYASAVVYNGYIYEIAGYASGYTAVVEWAQINNGGPGTTSAWTPNPTNLLNPTENATSVVYNGYVYEIGGWTAAVEYAPINSNGTLGTWNWTSNLLSSIGQATSVVYNGYVYEIGGYSSGVLNAVEYAAINSNGTLGSWNYVSNFLPGGGVDSATSVAYNGYIYEIGGWTTTVYYAPINANGNLGTWASTTSLPAALYIATSVVYDGYIYEIGGDNTSSVAVSSVYYAPINSNGTIGSWTATTSLPYATSAATSVAYNGYIYEIGGWTTTVYYAPINANGTLGPWTPTASLPTATGLATSVAYNGYAYEIGGYTTANTNTVDVTGLQSIPRVGRYSRLIDLSGLSGDDPTPYEVLVNGGDCSSGVCTNTNTNPGIGGLSGPGGIMVQYDFASNSCTTFNSLTTLPTGNSFMGVPKPLAYTVNGCSTATNVGRYMRITILLDDSQTATFPDITGNHTSINNLNVYYKAASTYRLMGGSTFSSGALQTLYAPP
jgi:N-acetylneuraminic acid mutarotase